jgi:hypothetical protein
LDSRDWADTKRPPEVAEIVTILCNHR